MNKKYYKWYVAFEGDEGSCVSLYVVADYHDAAVEKAWYAIDKLPTKEAEIFEVVRVSRVKEVEGSDANPFKPFRYSIESECPYAE